MRVALDSRLIKPGEYFVPVKGKKFDGHDFIEAVLAKGAAGIIEVDELYRLALEKLAQARPTVVGVAGSVGKSTMRAFLSQILSIKFKVLEGDLNTKLGLSVLIVNELADQKIIVAELGIDRLGEMKEVTDFVKPDFSILTKLEKEHLEFLGSLENVVQENLVAITNSKTGEGYLNRADRENVTDLGKIKLYPEENLDVEVVEAVGELSLPDHDRDYLLGICQLCRDRFGFSTAEFVKALAEVKKPKGRLNLIEGVNGSLIIDDSYNAVADESVIRGVEYAREVAKKKGKRLVIILSPMREMGESEAEQHQKVAEYLNGLTEMELIVVGDETGRYGKRLTGEFRSVAGAVEFSYQVKGDELFYIKGSQFYRLEKIVYYLMKDKEKAGQLLVRQDARWG